MRLPLTWLHEYTTPDMPVRDLATRLAMTGTEVDRIHLHGVVDVEHFVVGRVLSAEQHPDADDGPGHVLQPLQPQLVHQVL